jgi:(p)ppGpp synthase/HD superfamily hydrolase
MMLQNPLVLQAREFAESAHQNQKRKYTGLPYFTHCEEVAQIVAFHQGTPEEIAAAYLHDTVEDCNVTLDEIEASFGKEVRDLVDQLTDVSRPEDGNRAKRKAMDREHYRNASPGACTIKLADLISNSRTLAEHDPKFAKVYFAEKKQLLPFLASGHPSLLAQAEFLLWTHLIIDDEAHHV